MKLYTLTNIFNFSGINLLIIFTAFLGQEKFAADLAIIIGCSFFFTQIFSSNSRNILIINFTQKIYIEKLFLRIKLSVIIFFLINIFNYFYFKEFLFIYFLVSLLIILQWINELYLLKTFRDKKILKIKFYFFFNVFFYLILLSLFLFGKINSLNLYIFLFVLFNIFYLSIGIFEYKYSKLHNTLSTYKTFINELYNFSFYSSSSMVFANFFSRIIILEYLSKDLSGILFACLAIGSIPGSIFNNSFGPYLIKNKINILLKNYFYLFLLLFLSSIYVFYFENYLINYFFKEDTFKYYTLIYSYLGSFIMISALYIRQVLLFKNKFKLQKIFLLDILNSLSYLLIVLTICFLNIKIMFSLIFFIFSIYNLLIFFLYFCIDKYKQVN